MRHQFVAHYAWFADCGNMSGLPNIWYSGGDKVEVKEQKQEKENGMQVYRMFIKIFTKVQILCLQICLLNEKVQNCFLMEGSTRFFLALCSAPSNDKCLIGKLLHPECRKLGLKHLAR